MNSLRNRVASQKLVLFAVGFVLLVNAFVLAKVYINRSSVETRLQLTERELRLPYQYGLNKEDSSTRLNLFWTTPATEPLTIEHGRWYWHQDRSLKINEKHLASFNIPACKKTGNRRYKYNAWALLEFNGQSYADYVVRAEEYRRMIFALQPEVNTELGEKELAEKRKDADTTLKDAQVTKTRLFVVDAAADKALLVAAMQRRKALEDTRWIILPAEIEAGFYNCEKNEPHRNRVYINRLAVDSLYVPRDVIKGNVPKGQKEQPNAKFNAEIFYGRLHEPWVHSLQFCENDCS